MIRKWLILTLAMMAIPYVIPGFIVDSWQQALLAAAVIGLLNIIVKPLFIILTLPITILSLGLFLFFINPILLMLTDYFVPGLIIENFGTAFWAGLILTGINWLLNDQELKMKMIRNKKKL